MQYNKKFMLETFRAETTKGYHAQECVRFMKQNKDLMSLWRKSTDFEAFLHTVRSSDMMKWSEFAIYWYGTVRPDWYYRREYCGKFASGFHKTASDVGALKIGVDGMDLLLKNYYGDGINRVAVFDKYDPYVSWLFPHGGNIIRGEALRVYGYDCGTDVVCTLSGSYIIYTDDRFFALVKYSD